MAAWSILCLNDAIVARVLAFVSFLSRISGASVDLMSDSTSLYTRHHQQLRNWTYCFRANRWAEYKTLSGQRIHGVSPVGEEKVYGENE